MRQTFFLLTILFLSNMATFAQCSDCNLALAKDNVLTKQSLETALDYLSLIDQTNYEQFKSDKTQAWKTAGDYAEIFSGSFDGSENWQQFSEKRDRLFNALHYHMSSSNAMEEIKTVTNPIAFSYWAACIDKCYDNDPNLSKVYATLTGADSVTIHFTVRYKATSTSKSVVTCTILIENGLLLDEDAKGDKPTYVHKKTFQLEKMGSRGFTVHRDNIPGSSTLNISEKGSDVLHEILKFAHPKDEILEEMSYTVETWRDSLSRRIQATTASPNCAPGANRYWLFPIPAGSPYHFGPDRNLYYTNTISFTKAQENQYYANFSAVTCSGEHADACGWNRDHPQNDQKVITSADRTEASVTFSSGSLPCVWTCEADLHEKIKMTSFETIHASITGKYFVTRIPKTATKASITLTVHNDQYVVEPGKDDPTQKMKFIKVVDDGTYNLYNYQLNL